MIKSTLQIAPVLLILITYHTICAQPQTVLQENKSCDSWFPEPVQVHQKRRFSALFRKKFRVVEGFLADKDENAWKEVSREYIVKSLDGDALSTFGILKIVLTNLNSLPKLFTALLALVLTKFIFYGIWKLSLIDVFRRIGEILNFRRHRYGLTFVPIVCILGMLILNSHLSKTTDMALDGIGNLKTEDDGNFMPIKHRIKLILQPLVCKFQRTFDEQQRRQRPVLNISRDYLKNTVNGSYHQFLRYPRISLNQSQNCGKFRDDMYSLMMPFPSSYHGYPDLFNLTVKMLDVYKTMTSAKMQESLEIFARALGSIDDFVDRYHNDVLQLPSHRTIRFYYLATLVITVITVSVTCAFVILLVMKVQLKEQWQKILVYLGVLLMIICAATCVIMFLTIFIKIAFITLTHTACTDIHFSMFNASKPTNFSEKGFDYSLNYGDFLFKSAFTTATWFTMVRTHQKLSSHNDDQQPPIALDGERLWEPSKEFNETLEAFLEIARDYKKFNRNGCQGMEELHSKVEKMATDLGCQEQDVVQSAFRDIITLKTAICSSVPHSDAFTIPSEATLRQKSLTFWKTTLIPNNDYGLIPRRSTIDNFGTMQVYQVFMNPAMKLTPNVLEPWFAMAGLILAMTPIIFVMTLFLMCISPGLMGDKGEMYQKISNHRKSRFGSSSGSTSKSKSAAYEPPIEP